MNENDLQDRMARSTEWTSELTNDAEADLARGRSRLRRRRAAAAATTTAVAAIAVLGVSVIPNALGGGTSGPTPAASLSPVPSTNDPALLKAAAKTYLETVARHADPSRVHVVIGSRLPLGAAFCPSSWISGPPDKPVCQTRPAPDAPPPSAGPDKLDRLLTGADWREAGGTGAVRVEVVDKMSVGDPDEETKPDRCRTSEIDHVQYTSCKFVMVAGKRVLVGTVVDRPKAYFVSYVRPDGDLAIVQIRGGRSAHRPQDALPGEPKPVQEPSVDLAGLIAAVTDEALVLPR